MTRVALLTYRGNPHCGGQGVYVRHLSRELTTLGHHVEVFSGPPYPELDPGVRLTKVPALDLFAEPNPFRTPKWSELRTGADWLEFLAMRRGGFGEPLAFSLRVASLLRKRRTEFDVVHDNQCLGYGLLATGLPVLATVHHPIALDRDLSLAAGRRSARRWYRFVAMQHRVARRLPKILTVSHAAREAIVSRMGVERVDVVPVAADTRIFRPRPEIPRVPGRIVTTASADEPLKGLAHLLTAMRDLDAELVVVGRLKPDSPVKELVSDRVRFVSGISDTDLAELVASAEVVCVPSLYEGFSLPAAEAMACGTPLVTTTAGALPEVVGHAAVLVPPGDATALAAELRRVLGDAELRTRLGAAGLVRTAGLSWSTTAQATARHYQDLLAPTGSVLTC